MNGSRVRQIPANGSATRKPAIPEFRDLSQAEMENTTGGIARDTPAAIHVSDGALEQWDDGWWFLKFK